MKKLYICLALCFSLPAFSTMARFQKNDKACELVEQTLVILKPESVTDKHVGDILQIYENSDLRIIGLKMRLLTDDEAKKLYEVHKKKNFYSDLTSHISSSPVILTVLEGRNAIFKVRELHGSTNPDEANKKSIRSKFGVSKQKNAVHSSDSVKTAKKEISIFFTKDELFSPCAKLVFK